MRENKLVLKVLKKSDNISLEEYFRGYYVNSSYINNLINLKRVKINGVVIKTSKFKIKESDIIELSIFVDEVVPYKKDIEVLYEDEFIIAVNKPANMLVHSDGVSNETLTNAVNYYYLKKRENVNAYPVHRLDYETTGIVLFAKNKLSLAFLSVEIEKHRFKKEYVCLCNGDFKKKEGEINSPIGKDRHSNKQIVTKNGKEATSSYRVVNNGEISKVIVNIEHGRKHQIRVHMASINHPIYGDKMYGFGEDGGLKLHFKRVEFMHPYERKIIKIECKEDF